jgi:hypothetical protein
MKLVNKEFSKDWGYWTPGSVILLQMFLIAFTGFITFFFGYMSGSAALNSRNKLICTNQSDTQVVCTMGPKEVN